MREKLARLSGKPVAAAATAAKKPSSRKGMSSSQPVPNVNAAAAVAVSVAAPQPPPVSTEKPVLPADSAVKPDEIVPPVRMRTKAPLSQIQQQATTNGSAAKANGSATGAAVSASNNDFDSRIVLQRGLEVLNEVGTEDDSTEEIRKLDSQLDHLNHYMDKVEERIKVHNEKLMDTLKQQKEEREKRRRSFHERIALSQQEDDDFQRRLSTLMNRVDISKNRASMYDIISQMEIPKTDAQ